MLAATPPMGWNDWAHYQCRVTEQDVIDNANALVTSGLAAKGYDTITVDDCWMAPTRNADGDLVADPEKFPHGMAWLGTKLHELNLKFGIYEDAGEATCEGRPGSGQPIGGGSDHFAQDAKLFASWGVDFLKLDACNFWVPPGETKEQAFRKAYAAQSAALAATGRPIVFSESTPAYFRDWLGTPQPEYLSVLSWVGEYGQLWRIGTDIQIFKTWNQTESRWASVVNNFQQTRDLGRFTKPGNWNDPDFIIGGDPGLTEDEARSQMTLWSMMSAPLILSSDLTLLTQSPEMAAIVGNSEVIAIDQDALGRAASVVPGDPLDLLIKPLANGDRAVAIFNHGSSPKPYRTSIEELGFDECSGCSYRIRDVWNGTSAGEMSGT
ncbi:MAG TPA: glycoside hydrolase family 27 protein, partial [Myxococcaceae bacterium]|nr:glycoside hydrolase family 27 protein [Myxococcaceae bacterium]